MAVTKQDMVEHLASETGYLKQDIQLILEEALKFIIDSNVQGKTVQLRRFGTFAPVFREAKIGTNPVTHEPMKIASTTVPRFTASKDYRERVKKGNE